MELERAGLDDEADMRINTSKLMCFELPKETKEDWNSVIDDKPGA